MRKRILSSNDTDPTLSRLLSMMELNRIRLHEMLNDVSDEMLDFTPDMNTIETIGTLLYHIAAVDWSWVFEDIDGREMDEKWMHGFATRSWYDGEQLQGENKQFYLDLIDTTRDDILERLREFSDADLRQEFVTDGTLHFTLEWLFFHLINHEALHLGQISLIKRLYQVNKTSSQIA